MKRFPGAAILEKLHLLTYQRMITARMFANGACGSVVSIKTTIFTFTYDKFSAFC